MAAAASNTRTRRRVSRDPRIPRTRILRYAEYLPAENPDSPAYRIKFGATHTVKFQGQEFWHSTEVSDRVRPGEDYITAAARIDAVLQDLTKRGVQSTLTTALGDY